MTSNYDGSGEPDYQNGLNGENSGSASPKKAYTLSADAPVFVPKFGMPQSEFEPVPPEAPTLYMSGPEPTQSEIEEFEKLASQAQTNLCMPQTDDPVELFRIAVITLTTKGNVEEYIKPIVAKLNKGINDMAVLQKMIDILFNHSLSEPNFSYTGAQICKYLASDLKSHPTFSNFRQLFLNKCKSAYDDREAWVCDPARFNQLSNLAMLIGQLFLTLEDEVNGEVHRLGFLREAISLLLLTLLAEPNDDRIKTAAQLLKLTGFEITKNSHLPGDFTEIYNIIRSLEKHPSLNRTSHCLVNSVLSRLEYNWGVAS
ncbi:polyadenylate-binding protein-interacting protein 1-like [Mya arenaria]|uniref:polyadenylate-binding protein-interacting protein 1-like n=1 Tax=Mya arenaria TaxID=6604 RepID=UPI0022E0871E|nr:polyadenylate-binding protein-interacting protein 1-like [Mya arenaria]